MTMTIDVKVPIMMIEMEINRRKDVAKSLQTSCFQYSSIDGQDAFLL